MKKALLAVLCSGLLLSQTASAKNIVIGAPMAAFADKWQTYLQESVRDFDAKHNDVEIKLTDANGDPARQLNDVENFIDQKVDALLVVPTDPQIVKRIGRLAKKANIPLIVVNRKPNDEDMQYVTSYVGSDEIEAGRIQGDYIVNALNGKSAESLILMGILGLDATAKRSEGVKEVFARTGNVKVVSEQEGKWERDR
ncbi:substrate-binding domain-containing protein, partial [Glaesserella parasuis]